MKPPIPAVLRIDVEPDGHQPAVGQVPWQGFVDTTALVESLRRPLGDQSGHPFRPCWMFRLDPDVERCFGSRDYVVRRHGNLIERAQTAGDSLGIHVHALRWDAGRQVTFSDLGNQTWVSECIATAAQTFAECFGQRARRSSQGSYFVNEHALDVLEQAGIEVDLTPEPGLEPVSNDPSVGAYATATATSFRECPRRPYYPLRNRLDRAATPGDSRRDIAFVPLTSYDHGSALASLPKRWAKRLLGRVGHEPLNPWKAWPDPKIYWDLIERAADEGEARYCALAVRTDPTGTISHERVRRLLEYLPRHPVSRRLRFVDPLAPAIRALADA